MPQCGIALLCAKIQKNAQYPSVCIKEICTHIVGLAFFRQHEKQQDGINKATGHGLRVLLLFFISNVKLEHRITFFQPDKAYFDVKLLSLRRLHRHVRCLGEEDKHSRSKIRHTSFIGPALSGAGFIS